MNVRDLFTRRLSVSQDEHPAESSPDAPVPGDRGIPSVNRARSLQSRVSSILALTLMSALGLGLLTFYYAHVFTRTARAQVGAQKASQARAQGEMALPALGPIRGPAVVASDTARSEPVTLAQQLLGPAPPLSDPAAESAAGIPLEATAHAASPGGPASRPRSARERQLAGAVFARQGSESRGSSPADPPLAPEGSVATPMLDPAGSPLPEPPTPGSRSALAALLRPSATPAVRAQLLPTRRLLLPKGAFIDCTLETAIDSTLPGMTTCITATDTFGVDGRVVLLERGTKLVGETRGEVQQGAARVFVLWTEARTPTGVVIPLASPGTDELGRAGLSGTVNRHFWERFGAAILVSVINGAAQAAANSTSGRGGAVILNPSSSTDALTDVLKETVAIPPTITKPQGDRIQVLVARDLDFRSVYELREVSATEGDHP